MSCSLPVSVRLKAIYLQFWIFVRFSSQKLSRLLWVDGFLNMGKHQSNDLLKLIQAIQGLWRLLVLGLGPAALLGDALEHHPTS